MFLAKEATEVAQDCPLHSSDLNSLIAVDSPVMKNFLRISLVLVFGVARTDLKGAIGPN